MKKPATRVYGDDVPDEVIDRLRDICAGLPDASEETAWKGVRWKVRSNTFAHVLSVEDEATGRGVVLTFRSESEEFEILRLAGPPFHVLGWSRNVLALTIDDDTDWPEVAELVTDSFCVQAPKQLAALVDRPAAE